MVMVMAFAAIAAFSAIRLEEGSHKQVALWPFSSDKTHMAVQWLPIDESLAPPMQCVQDDAQLLRGCSVGAVTCAASVFGGT